MSGLLRSSITLVSGLPRSGTSMMMQMLEAGGILALTDQVRQADDDNQRGYYELEAVKRTRSDSDWLRGASGKVVKVIYSLLYELPPDYEYRVVFMRRDLDEVLTSQRMMLDRRGEKGASVPLEKLRRIFSVQLEKVSAWLEKQPNFSVLDTDYHAVLASPLDQSNRISEFLGGGLDVDGMAAAVVSSLNRHRSKR